MSRLRVLVTAEIKKSMLDPLSDLFDFHFHGYCENYHMLSHEELKSLCKNTDILISEFDTVDDDIISSSNIKLIICCRGGVSSVIDLDSAKKHGVIVCNNVGRNKESAVDFTIGLIFDLMRNITITDRMVHNDDLETLRRPMPKEYKDTLWGLDGESPYVRFRGRSSKNTMIGIMGYGQIGRLLAERLDAIGFRYIICTRHPPEGDDRFVSMERLLKESDIVTLHISGNPEKKPVITSKEFGMMKNSAYLINTSRGYLVDEDAMYDALASGRIAGAAVDVLVKEPIDPNDRLLSLRNLIITPHIGGSSQDTLICGTTMVINALNGYLKGDIPHRVV